MGLLALFSKWHRDRQTTDEGRILALNAASIHSSVTAVGDTGLRAPGHGRETNALSGQRPSYGMALAAAAQLVGRAGDLDQILHELLDQTVTATGAVRAILWAYDDLDQPLTLVAWTARDDWRPDEALLAPLAVALPTVRQALDRATPVTATTVTNATAPHFAARLREEALLGQSGLLTCAARSDDVTRGVLAIVAADAAPVASEETRVALAACAALAGRFLERRAIQAMAAQPAQVDPYMALPDYTTLTEHLDAEIGRARRFKQSLAVLALDIDRFHKYSHALGVTAADALLREMATLIGGVIREVDLLGRGNDSGFIVLLPMSEAEDALRVGERVHSLLERQQPDETVAAVLGRVTVSGGAVSYPADGSTAEELLAAAEQTISYAKRMGRNQIRLRGLGELDLLPELTTSQLAQQHDGRFITEAFQGLLNALTLAGDLYDHARPGHGRVVGYYARALAEACGLSPNQVHAIELAGTLHDAGKFGLPEPIIGKKGALTDEERAILREQPAVGKLMLAQIPALESVVTLVEHTHERFDGGGYPAGISGDQIPFGSRIIAIAEAYEAMTTDRPYRQALSRDTAVGELWQQAGKQYDPRLIDTFVSLVLPLLDDPRAISAMPAQLPATWQPELLERLSLDGHATGDSSNGAGAPDNAEYPAPASARDDAAPHHFSAVEVTENDLDQPTFSPGEPGTLTNEAAGMHVEVDQTAVPNGQPTAAAVSAAEPATVQGVAAAPTPCKPLTDRDRKPARQATQDRAQLKKTLGDANELTASERRTSNV